MQATEIYAADFKKSKRKSGLKNYFFALCKVGIAYIELISTVGNVDTYRV